MCTDHSSSPPPPQRGGRAWIPALDLCLAAIFFLLIFSPLSFPSWLSPFVSPAFHVSRLRGAGKEMGLQPMGTWCKRPVSISQIGLLHSWAWTRRARPVTLPCPKLLSPVSLSLSSLSLCQESLHSPSPAPSGSSTLSVACMVIPSLVLVHHKVDLQKTTAAKAVPTATWV